MNRSFLTANPSYPITLSLDAIRNYAHSHAEELKKIAVPWLYGGYHWNDRQNIEPLANQFGLSTTGEPVMNNLYPIANIGIWKTNTPGYYAMQVILAINGDKWYCFDGSMGENTVNPYPDDFQASWEHPQNNQYFIDPMDVQITMFFKL